MTHPLLTRTTKHAPPRARILKVLQSGQAVERLQKLMRARDPKIGLHFAFACLRLTDEAEPVEHRLTALEWMQQRDLPLPRDFPPLVAAPPPDPNHAPRDIDLRQLLIAEARAAGVDLLVVRVADGVEIVAGGSRAGVRALASKRSEPFPVLVVRSALGLTKGLNSKIVSATDLPFRLPQISLQNPVRWLVQTEEARIPEPATT